MTSYREPHLPFAQASRVPRTDLLHLERLLELLFLLLSPLQLAGRLLQETLLLLRPLQQVHPAHDDLLLQQGQLLSQLVMRPPVKGRGRGSGTGLDGVQRRVYQYEETAIEKHYVLQAFTHESHKSIPCYVIHWLLTRRLPVRKHSRCRFTPGNYAPSLMNRMDAEITVILHDCPFPIWYPSLQWSPLPAGL